MSTKKWKNKELNGLLNERWGFSMDLGMLNEQKMPMKKDTDDVDEDGDTDEMVPAFLDKGDVKKPKKSGNPQPPQLAKAQGKKADDNDEEESDKKENNDDETSDLEAEILGVLEAEGGAAGMEALEKELDASKDQIRREIEKSDKMEKHRDGDIIDITGLEDHDDKDDDEEEENENLYESWGFSMNLNKLNESKDLEEMRIVATGEDKGAGMKMSDMKPMGTMEAHRIHGNRRN